MTFWDFSKDFLINRGYVYSSNVSNLHEVLEKLRKEPNFVDLKILEKQHNMAIIKTIIKFTEAMRIIRKNGGYIVGPFFIRKGKEIWNLGFDDRDSLEKTLSELERNHEFQVKKDNYLNIKDLSLVISNINLIVDFIKHIKNLSSLEQQIIEFAIKLGYYYEPKKVSIDDLSNYLGLSKGYISKKLRRSVGRILEEVLKLKKSLEYLIIVGINMEYRDWLVLGIGVTSLLLIVAALLNLWQAFAVLMAINLSIWLILGASNSKRKEAIIIGLSALLIWLVCLSLIFYYWGLFYKKVPEFWIAGMHPGFFIMFPVMWLLIFIPTTLGYALLFERINKPALEEFKKKIGKGEG